MIRTRIIPCLLIADGRLIKTIQFKNPTYIGDPLNAVRIFNEKSVDEIMIIDVEATAQNKSPNYKLIEQLAAEARMPVCYGGGIKQIDQIKKIIGIGIEKVSISSAAINSLKIIQEASQIVGAQSIVFIMDVKSESQAKPTIWIDRGSVNTGIDPLEMAQKIELAGAGELVINSIDRDGTQLGYDHQLICLLKEKVNIPVTALGGAGSIEDLRMMSNMNIHGASAGSLFIFKGKFKAVLINYPTTDEKKYIFR